MEDEIKHIHCTQYTMHYAFSLEIFAIGSAKSSENSNYHVGKGNIQIKGSNRNTMCKSIEYE